ncbi:MAG: beta strand repeat-containing protein, partial [Plesiomonas shigelloides]
MKAKEKMVLLGIFLLFSSKSLVSYSIPVTSENNNDLTITSGTAIEANKNHNRVNNATITVSGDKTVGMKANNYSSGDPSIVENRGTINVTAGAGTIGMQAAGSGTQAINAGTITHNGNNSTSNAMLAQNGGYLENNGIIEISGTNASGMAADTKSSSLKNTGTIVVDKNAKGIKLTNGARGLNSGKIDVKNGTGMSIETGLIGENTGDIYVSGDKSTGMSILNGSSGINSGTINVTAGEFTSGMKVDGVNSTGTNNGAIIHTGNGKTSNAMLAQNGGYLENNGTIEISGTNASGMTADKNESSLKNTGTILVDGNAKGIKIVGATGLNTGKIDVKNGAGMSIETGAKGENTGEINVLGKGTGISIAGGSEGLNSGIIKLSSANSTGVSVGNSKGKNTGDIHVTGNSSTGISVTGGGTGVNNGNIYVTANQYTSGMKVDGAGSVGINNGTIIHTGDGQTSNAMLAQNGGYLENNGTVEVSGVNASGMAADGNSSSLKNTGTIVIDKNAKGIKLTNGAIGISSGKIDIKNGTGVSIESSSKGENNGDIYVTGDKSVGISITAGSEGVNTGNIYVTGQEFTSGMQVVGSGSKGINNGAIIHTGNGKTSNAMLAQTGGYLENNGAIEVSEVNASGMAADGNSSSLKNTGTIIVDKKARGIKLSSGANGISSGKIDVKEGTGISIETGAKGENQGDIYVTGNSSYGIAISGKGEGVNNGNIYISGKQYTSGMKVDGVGSIGINNGVIIHEGDGQTSNAMLAQTGGYIENNRLIQVSAVNASGMAADKEGSSLKNQGDILVLNKAKGIKLSNGASGISSGKIVVEEGTGVSVET